ncbi:MAG: hypothetical protein LBR57_00710 [Alistipes sp.]|jgi:hypothetical protein|nr:hypothetical protein [Alistipes sp.]
MKKISVILLAIALMLGVGSCQKNDGATGPVETGSMRVYYGFQANPSEEGTRAYALSTAVPSTAWNANIKSLMLLLTDGDGVIRVARTLPIPTDADHEPETILVSDVPAADDYIGYIIANYETATTAGITPNFTVGSTLGKNIDDLTLSLVAATGYPAPSVDEPVGTTAYNPAGEVFIARTADIDIVANAALPTNAAFALTRAVSLLRVRINRNTGDGVDNTKIEFMGANAGGAAVRLRKADTRLQYDATATAFASYGAVPANLIYSPGGWTNTVTAGYVKTSNGDPAVLTDFLTTEQQYYKDFLILPGGANDGADMFDIVITGWAPSGYTVWGAETPLTTGQLVHWNGTIKRAALANRVLEVNVDLVYPGKGIVPPVVETGQVNISVDLVPWGGIDQYNMQVR